MLPTARKLAFTDVPVVDLGAAWSNDPAARSALAQEIADVCGLAALGVEPAGEGAAQAFFDQELVRWQRVIDDAGIKLEH